jgi:hypothetical protein
MDGLLMKKDFLNKGDILLVSYKWCPLSWIIQLFLGSKWNHTAWIVNEHTILEVKRYGVCVRLIRNYYNHWLYSIKIVRPKNLTQVEIELVECLLLDQKCTAPYSKLLISYLLIAQQSKKQPLRPTCSGFIAHALAQVGFHFNNKPTHLITPKDIAMSDNIETFYE